MSSLMMLRASALIFVALGLSLPVRTQALFSVRQCCILMDVWHDGEKVDGEHEIWDVWMNFVDSVFELSAVSFVQADGKRWYTYCWQQRASGYAVTAPWTVQVVTNGRAVHGSKMTVVFEVDSAGERIVGMRGVIPSGLKQDHLKEYRLNDSEQLRISPFYNSTLRRAEAQKK